MTDEKRVLTCVYCGMEYPQDTPAWGNQILTDHIKVCEKHPMRKLEEECEQLRVQLAGCGVAAKCDTEKSREEQKCNQGDYGWSQSYQDVVDMVDKLMKYRKALIGLVGAETKEELEAMEMVIRLTPAPDADKANIINAIHALY
jgi:hypothetical protein